MAADTELSVKNGAELLDRLIKDIVSESAASYVSILNPPKDDDEASRDQRAFKLPAFIPLLQERIFVLNPFTRTFLVSWITLLDSIPDLELISFLPSFLGGLLRFLSDVNQDVHTTTKVALDRFLLEIRKVADIKRQKRAQSPIQQQADDASDDSSLDHGREEEYLPGQDIQVDHARILDILLNFLVDTSEEEIQTTTLGWIESFFDICPDDILPYVPRLLSQVLPALSHDVEKVRQAANRVNDALTSYIMSLPEDVVHDTSADPSPQVFDYEAAVNALTLQFLNEHEASRVAAISWLIMLHSKSPKKILAIHQGTFPALLKTLSDPSQAVVTRDLLLLSQICKRSDDSYFTVFMVSLLKLFCTDRKLLETRGNLIIRQLCVNLSAERIYRTMADCLERDEDIEFASIMVQNLNNNLITAPELAELRKRLRNLDTRDGQTLFVTLFNSWCHNAVATFSLCLLAQAYEQAYHLLQIFTDLEMTVTMLIQIDKLVQLLESPVFTYLRLQLLEPERYPHLYKCMYGVLMLLPQSSAFAALKNRLNSVSAIGYLHIAPRSASSSNPTTATSAGTPASTSSRLKARDSEVKWAELLDTFRATQDRASRRSRGGSAAAATGPGGAFRGLNIAGLGLGFGEDGEGRDAERNNVAVVTRRPESTAGLGTAGAAAAARGPDAGGAARNSAVQSGFASSAGASGSGPGVGQAGPGTGPATPGSGHSKGKSSLSQLSRFRVAGKSKKTG